jgi:predicted nucleotidyltransferase
MVPGLPVLETYIAALPIPVEGIYLTGSAALDDWQPDSSDLDILVVTPAGDSPALVALHEKLSERPYLDAVYIPRDSLGARDGLFPHVVDGEWKGVTYRPNPVLWATLDSHGVTLRGPLAGDLGVAPDRDWLREWNKGNLESYWRPLAARARAMLAGLRADAPVPAEAVVWGALGPGRLHHTITTGGIISKTASADYTASLLPSYASLLARAKAARLGDSSVTFSAADGAAACDLIDAVADLGAQA